MTATSSRPRDHRDRTARRAARRVELLDAAVRAVRRDGPRVSMDVIAAEAGVTKPILYRHFGDRVGLAAALAEQFGSALVAELDDALARNLPPEQLLRATIDTYLAFVERDPHLYSFLVGGLGAPVATEVANGLVAQVGQRVALVLGEQLRSLGIDSGPAELWAFGIVGMVHLAGDWWLERRTMTRDRLVDDITTLLWSGLGGLAPRSPRRNPTESRQDAQMTFAAQPGAQLERWDILVILLVAFGAIVVALALTGRRARREDSWLLWVPNGLERVTGIPGWAAGMIGTASFGLLVAGIGFYNDVAWHVGRGRDKELLTAPHTMIIVGLGLIALAAGIGILFATLQRVDTTLRVKNLRVPWSAVPLGLLGVCALSGFPLDDLWHATYGVDVTMWSPTHMLMICGAAFSLIAAWLALAEAGVSFRENRWTKIVHFIAAWFVLAGLTAPLGEFRFGVPQFQQLFHPVLLLLAAAFAFVPTRIVLGRGWAIALALATFLPESIGFMSSTGDSGFVPTRTPGMFLASAVAVELAAVLFGTDRRLRFALTSGLGVATLGLAGEWLWNRNATQPWNGALMRDALILGGVVAVGAAVLGAAYAGAVNRQPGRLPRVAVMLAAAAVVVALLLPMPRRTSNVVAQIDMTRTGDAVSLTVHLDPPDAAQNARWFQAISWQGGGLRVVGLHAVAPGSYVADAPLPVGGKWKAMLRLHTGAVMMSAPVFLPADPEIGVPEIPAVSRTIAFGDEQQYLMREVKPGPNTVMVIAYVLIGLVVLAWAAAFVLACVRIPKQPPLRTAGTRDRDPAPPTVQERVLVSR